MENLGKAYRSYQFVRTHTPEYWEIKLIKEYNRLLSSPPDVLLENENELNNQYYSRLTEIEELIGNRIMLFDKKSSAWGSF